MSRCKDASSSRLYLAAGVANDVVECHKLSDRVGLNIHVSYWKAHSTYDATTLRLGVALFRDTQKFQLQPFLPWILIIT
jgi:hypothetical protein